MSRLTNKAYQFSPFPRTSLNGLELINNPKPKNISHPVTAIIPHITTTDLIDFIKSLLILLLTKKRLYINRIKSFKGNKLVRVK